MDFNKKQRNFNSYSEDYAVVFYIRLLHFSSRLLTEYLKHSLFHLYLFYSIVFLCFFITGSIIRFNNFEDLFLFLLILVTLICCGVENRDALKWKFLSEAEQNETLGRPKAEYGFSKMFYPM